MFYIYLLLLFVVIVISVLYIISLVNNIYYGVPQVATFDEDLPLLKKVFDKYNLKGKKIVDLGSGTGKMLRFFEKKYNAKATGYEIDFSNVLISRFFNKIFGLNTKSINKNYFNAELKEFDFIYTYLFPKLMQKLEQKIWSDTKKGTIIFVNAFPFEKHKPIEIFQKNGKDKIFVYKV